MRLSIVLLAAVLLVGTPAFTEEMSAKYKAGYEMGKAQGREDVNWTPICISSFVFPIFGAVFAHFIPPDPPTVTALTLLEGKSEDYKTGFLKGYRESKWRRRKAVAGACAAFSVAVGLMLSINQILSARR